jgi:hypothetical protein
VIRVEGNLGVFSGPEGSFGDQESAIKQRFSALPVNGKYAKIRKLTKISPGGIWSDD